MHYLKSLNSFEITII